MSANQRTSILIEDGERGGIRVKLVRTPNGEKGISKPVPKVALSSLLQPVDWDAVTETDARDYGQALHKALCQDRGLKAAVRDALRAAAGDVRPLCFNIQGTPGLSDQWLWEALWVKKKEFLALQPQWPIARVVDTDMEHRLYHAPVRVLAIMSALGVPARGEWDGIRSAVENARSVPPGGREEDRLPVHVTAIVGERKLLAEMVEYEEELRAKNDNWLTVVGLDSQQTIDAALAAEPHILHLFCHGKAEYGGALLSLATLRDHAEADPRRAVASVTIDLPRLRSLVNGRKLWLVTLNCCSGARSAGSLQSLAHTTVEAGAGAALGWRMPIAPEDANLLCQTVYAALLQQLRALLTGARVNDVVMVELANLGYDLRYQLRNKHRDLLTWALPVLYVARDPVGIVVAAAQPDDRNDLSKTDISAHDSDVITASVMNQVLRDIERAQRLLRGVVDNAPVLDLPPIDPVPPPPPA
jgi:hypothetical protein